MTAEWERANATAAPVLDEVTDPLEGLAQELLLELGEDPHREGLRDTPRRYARWWREFMNYDSGSTETTFRSTSGSQTVVVSDIKVWSLCEHHLLPFYCSLTLAYRPHAVILGLSKFARIAHKHAHRLQVQERLVSDIASEIEQLTGSADVAVIGRGEHLCMTMRGIKTSARMTSTVLRGVFEKDSCERSELFTLLHR